MEKQIGYGEMVFKKQFDVKLKDGSTERKECIQKRYYKVKKRGTSFTVHRINTLQLNSLKSTPGVINMQPEVVKYFTGYRQSMTQKMIDRMNANKSAIPVKKKSWFEIIIDFFKSLFPKKHIKTLDQVEDRLKT